ncbi:N-6 DNA methylase [Salmonella enterica]|uniref:N-6 DNA methylase n=1 Tax=Salmonella enterica TaxID=28901 RepID=UPI001F40C2C4|nr:N-6 DNA methylase [Salmonella enterica]
MAAIILPDGILFREGKEYEIRKKIIKNNHISAIIYLPKGMFKTTAIATNIIVFKKKQNQHLMLVAYHTYKSAFPYQMEFLKKMVGLKE